MKKILKIGALEAQAGQKFTAFIPLRDRYGQVPVTLINGTGEGKVLLLTAGVHPDEYLGIAAAIQLSNELRPEDISGGLVIVPMANYSGFLAKKDPTSRRTGKI